MRLIGRYASPFVRRVAATMQHYGLAYEHESVMPFGAGKAALAAINPIARVPALVLDDGETLIESAAILDYLDERVGPDRALTPPAGPARRKVLHRLAVATGAMDKLVAVSYERHFRPEAKWHWPWLEACERQIEAGFGWLDRSFDGDWLVGAGMSQADISLGVFWSFGRASRPRFFARMNCARIDALSDRLEATPPFQATQREPEPLTDKL